jgi:hypothetical protein
MENPEHQLVKNPGTCPTGKGWESGEMNEFYLK